MPNMTYTVQNLCVLCQPPQYSLADSTQLNNVGQYMGQQVGQRSRPEAILPQQNSNTTNSTNELRHIIPEPTQNRVIGVPPCVCHSYLKAWIRDLTQQKHI